MFDLSKESSVYQFWLVASTVHQTWFQLRLVACYAEHPTDWFQSVTGVRLVGHMQYGLAKLILNAFNPVTLECLCLDMVQDRKITNHYDCTVLGDMAEDGRIIAAGVLSGRLTTLTGRCKALRTLTVRRIGESGSGSGWHAGADEAFYTEWASFVCSVRGTVEKFTFEHWPRKCHGMPPATEKMDRRFRRIVRQAIISGNWPCLTTTELGGVVRPHGQDKNEPITELKAALGEDVTIVVSEYARNLPDLMEYRSRTTSFLVTSFIDTIQFV